MRRRYVLVLLLVACGDDTQPPAPTPIALPKREPVPDASSDAEVCETKTDPSNCGTCGKVCPTGPRGAASCANGTCVLTCEDGWADCNGSATDGCEMDTKMTVDHCGACDRDCRACGGSTCAAGACDAKTFATRRSPITLLTVDADRITYADASSVSQIARADAKVSNIYTVPKTPWLVTQGPLVFFPYPGKDGVSGIYATTAGFIGPQIAAYARGENVDTVAVDDTGVYWAAETQNQQRRLVRCKDCTAPTVLSPVENELRPGAIALDATTVFFGSGDMIRRIEKTADELRTLAVGQSARTIAVDADYIYWINEESKDVSRIAKTGGDASVLVSGLLGPRFLVLASGHLYVGDRDVVVRTDTDGRGRLDLASAPGTLGPIAIDQACVWFGAGADLRQVTR